jgi:hypothetical protein
MPHIEVPDDAAAYIRFTARAFGTTESTVVAKLLLAYLAENWPPSGERGAPPSRLPTTSRDAPARRGD